MATYTEMHEYWTKGISSYGEPDWNWYHNGSWTSAPDVRVYKGGAWNTVFTSNDTTSTEPKVLLRRSGLWVALNVDNLNLEVCDGAWTTNTSYTNSWTVPSSMFGKTVSKVVVTHYLFYTKQYGGGTNYVHRFRKNGSTLVEITGKRDDGYTCTDNNWSYATSGTLGETFVPGDVMDVYVYVPNTFGYDYGGTRINFRMVWYFT